MATRQEIVADLAAIDFEALNRELRAAFIVQWDTPTLDERSRAQLREWAERTDFVSVTPRMYHTSSRVRKVRG